MKNETLDALEAKAGQLRDVIPLLATTGDGQLLKLRSNPNEDGYTATPVTAQAVIVELTACRELANDIRQTLHEEPRRAGTRREAD